MKIVSILKKLNYDLQRICISYDIALNKCQKKEFSSAEFELSYSLFIETRLD